VVGWTTERAVWLRLEVGSRKEAHTARPRPFWRSIDGRRIALWMGTFQSKAGLLCGVWTRGLCISPVPFTEGGEALQMQKEYGVLLRLLQTP